MGIDGLGTLVWSGRMNRWVGIHAEVVRLYLLEDKARQIVHQHVRAVPARQMGFEAVRQETRLRCAEYEQEITASVKAWEWGHNLATISAEAQMWRYVRLNSALTWLSLVVGVPGWETVLGEPLRTDQAVVQWLLTAWWDSGGVQMRTMLEMGLE